MADRRVQMRGSSMKLIDILRNIKSTKNELKKILDENNDLSRYPVSIHNVLAEIYNKNYIDGFHDMWFELTGEDRYCTSPRAYLDYTANDKNYDPFSVEGLIDIMTDVCGYRIEMKDADKLDTDSDYFPSYPSLLNIALTTMESSGYTDGQDEAYNIIYDENPPVVNTPIGTWNDEYNTFTMYSEQANVTMWYMVGNESSPKIIYTDPVEINEDTTIYFYATIGKYKSTVGHVDTEHNFHCVIPRRAPASPNISFNGAATISINAQNESDLIYYTVGDIDGDKILYRYSFDLPAATSTMIYAWATNTGGWSASSSLPVSTWQSGPSISEDDGWNGLIINGTPVITYQCSMPTATWAAHYLFEPYVWTIRCDTQDATIYYMLVEGGATPKEDEWIWTEYTQPLEIDQDGVLFTYAARDGYSDSSIARYVTYRAEQPEEVKPQAPTFTYEVYDYISGLKISSRNENTGIYYSFGPPQDFDDVSTWMKYEDRNVKVYPENDCVIYAKSFWLIDPTVSSDYVTYDYKNYFSQFDIKEPVYTRIDNSIMLSYQKTEGLEGEYELWYSTDGQNPKNGHKWGYHNTNYYGIPIVNDNTIIKAVVKYWEPGTQRAHYSKVVTWTFSPDAASESYKNQYFTVRGATTIYLSEDGNVDSAQNLSWSYNMIDWNVCNTWSITGLDPTRDIYIHSSKLGQWKTMTFSEDDEVTVSGNIISLIYGESFRDSLNPNIQVNIPTEWKRTYQFYQLFKGATSLIDAANLYIPDYESKGNDFEEMFYGCTSLKHGPTFLPKNIGISSCLNMFYGCTSLEGLNSLNINKIGAFGCCNMFAGCTSLVDGGHFNITEINEEGMQRCFNGCTSLTDIELTVDCDLTPYCFDACFKNCSSLTSPDIHINATVVDTACCQEMFKNCSSLTSFTSLNATSLKNSCYLSMFEGCTSLYDMGSISATSAAVMAMKRMFAGCTSLTMAPTIRINEMIGGSVDRNCMYEMFAGCERLNYIKALFLTDPIYDNPQGEIAEWTLRWVQGVAPSGTFEMSEDADWLRIGESAIPRGWRVIGSENQPGIITSVYIQNMDEVVIEADKDDDIYYCINTREWNENAAQLYTQPIVINNSITLVARTKNSRGTYGPVYVADDLIYTLPEIIFSRVGNYVTLSSSPAYNEIYWQTSKEIQYNLSSHLYESAIPVTEHVTIHAWGVTKNGNISKRYINTYSLDLGIPTGECNMNIVTLSLPAGAPDESFIVYYMYEQGSSKGNLHTYTEPFLIEEDMMIEAYVKWFDGVEYITGSPYTFKAIWDPDGYSYIINIPIFRRKYEGATRYNQNLIYCTYGQTAQYAEQIPDGVHIYYKINNGETQEWIFKNGLETSYGSQILLTMDSDIEAWATDGVQTTDHYTYHFDYIDDQQGHAVPAPTIELTRDGSNNNRYWLRVTCSDENAQPYYYDTINKQKKQINNGESVMLNLGNFEEITIYAWAIGDYGFESDTVSRTFRNEYYVELYAPLSITFNATTKVVTINADNRNPSGSTISYALYENETSNPIYNKKYVNGSFVIDRNYYVYAATEYNGSFSGYIMKYCSAQNDYNATVTRDENTVTVSAEAVQGVYYEYSLNGVSYTRFTDDVDIDIPERSSISVYTRSYKDGVYSAIQRETFEFDPQYTVIPTAEITSNEKLVTITCSSAGNNNYVLTYKINNGEWNIYTNPFEVEGNCYVYARNTYYDGRYTQTSHEISGIKQDPPIYWLESVYTYTMEDTPDIELSNEESLSVVFSSSDTSVATIDNLGNVTLVSEGICTLSAYYAGDLEYYEKTVTCTLQIESYYATQYFAIKALEYGRLFYELDVLDISYSTDNGNTWTLKHCPGTGENVVICDVAPNDVVLIKGNNQRYKGRFGVSSGQDIHGARFEVQGNIMSLIYGDEFIGKKVLQTEYAFSSNNNGNHSLFSGKLINTNNLVLPATTLTEGCYMYMFKNSTLLLTTPVLPATILVKNCYFNMFSGCTSLTTAPVLPATTLARSCYANMFRECTSLTTAPVLPATTLYYQCYGGMFYGCTSLTTAPVLPATTLEIRCYNIMFSGCTLLNNVKCLATNISFDECLDGWMTGVAATGTFTKAAGVTWPTGSSGIPTGWTVIEE